MNFPKYVLFGCDEYEFVDFSDLEGTKAHYVNGNGCIIEVDIDEI